MRIIEREAFANTSSVYTSLRKCDKDNATNQNKHSDIGGTYELYELEAECFTYDWGIRGKVNAIPG